MKLPELSLGNQVAQYRILALLGQGAMGRVYRARDDGSASEVALKVMGLPDDTDADFVREIWRRFDREVTVLRALVHPHIVRVTDMGSVRAGDNAFPWLCMDLIPGARSIGTVYRQRPDLGWLLDRTRDILETLEYVHDMDIIHRDIKPDNVLISSDDELFVVDFGLARVVQADRDRLTRTGQTVGTLQYMALEQIGGSKDVDLRADLYSVGMLLFELVEEVQNWAEFMSDILCAQGVRFKRPVAVPLQRFIQRLAAPRPQDRYRTATQALTALTAVRDTIQQ